MSNWHLDDVEKAAQAFPDSFFIPSKEEKQSLVAGKRVQLHFILDNPKEKEPRAERMWVTISKVLLLKQGYEGVLNNQPKYIKGLKAGDKIKFQPKHIAQVFIARDDPNWLNIHEKFALVSKMIFEEDKVVRFLYREKPDREEDSGWRIFSGTESDEYNNDANNIQLCNIGWLIDFDPTLLEVFKNNFDIAFERENKASPWKQVKDWSASEDENT